MEFIKRKPEKKKKNLQEQTQSLATVKNEENIEHEENFSEEHSVSIVFSNQAWREVLSGQERVGVTQDNKRANIGEADCKDSFGFLK